MPITGICVSSLPNIGSVGCETKNPFLDPVALILTSSTFSFLTFTAFATETDWRDGIAAGNVIPIQGILEAEDQSEETQYHETTAGKRVFRRLGQYRYMFRFVKTFAVHKKLQSFRNADVKAFIVDSAGNVWGTNPTGTVVKGFSLSMINPEKLTMPTGDGTPAWTTLTLDFLDANEWNKFGEYVNPTSWSVTALEPLVDVDIDQVGVATATSLTVSVMYDNGLDAEGNPSLVGIGGLAFADFTISGTGTLGIAGDFVDNGDGTYDFVTVGLITGDIVNIVTPSNLTDKTGIIVESTGGKDVTVP